MKATPTKRSFREMHQRCGNPNSDKWKWYGGRGITVCERWASFDNFLSDMGERPAGKTLDRVNVNGNYEPGNCCWATPLEQGANKRNNRLLTIGGETMHMAEASRRYGVKQGTIWKRLLDGWPDEMAASTAPRSASPFQRKPAHNKKLSDEQRVVIRASSETTAVLVAMYGVSKTLIQAVRRTDSANNRNQDRATR
jgi:hypothetical protein